MLFSQRIGLAPVNFEIQLTSMDRPLRVALWNAYQPTVIAAGRRDGLTKNSVLLPYLRALWDEVMQEPVDRIDSGYDRMAATVHQYFFRAEWYQVYEFLEFSMSSELPQSFREALAAKINKALERELSAYRLIEGLFVPITDQIEISNIEESLNSSSLSKGSALHLRTALTMLSDRINPDYRNSIKESISAVESVAKQLTSNPKATLGDALTALERKGDMHNALRKGLSSLYGYTSDAQGIRHALMDEKQLSFADAKFMLVACTAFINFMTEKSAEW
ncbi:hypothetical protein [Stenotrophomonas sp.]|uniref:AbiJ-NTD4 domain-containing protein n=1 Tax=Stenotrophomonas sp. TaxID=69392 RepID=UPI0028AA49C9|nr:hypothetical protein [Stenotrophomonas sp.]